MDVRCAPFDRLGEHEVGELDDRGVVDPPLLVQGLEILLPHDLQVFVQLGDDVLEIHRLVEELVDRGGDVLLGRQHQLHRVTGLEPDGVDDRHVRRIGHGHDQLRPDAVDREREVLLDHFLGQEADDFDVDLVFGEVDHGNVELAPQESQQFRLLDEAGLDEDRSDPLLGLLLGIESVPQLLGGDDVPLQQDLPDFGCHYGH